jgi:F-type H+-transporting ATPase subunit alpha
VPVERIRAFESGLYSFMDSNHPEINAELVEKMILSDELREKVGAAVREFKTVWAG